MEAKVDRLVDVVAGAPFVGQPLFINRMGRGRTGGSTVLDVLIRLMRDAGRDVMIADGDVKNPTLSVLYPPGKPGAAMRPKNADVAGLKEWIFEVVGQAAEQGASVAFDLGGGDRVMAELADEMKICQIAKEAGFTPVGVYCVGLDQDDLRHVQSLVDTGAFPAERQVLFFNEFLIAPGRNANQAYQQFMESSSLRAIVGKGISPVRFPAYAKMEKLRAAGKTLWEVMDGDLFLPDGDRMNLLLPLTVKKWLTEIRESMMIADVLDWFVE